MTIVHGSLGSFVTSFHRYHSSLNPFAPSEHSEPKEAEGLGDVHLTSSP